LKHEYLREVLRDGSKNINTPYWSIKSTILRLIVLGSTNREVDIDQIVIISDTGGIGANVDLETGFNHFFEIHHPLIGSGKRNKTLNSVSKKLVFRSQENDPEFVSLSFKNVTE
jgi:hypothetical protein